MLKKGLWIPSVLPSLLPPSVCSLCASELGQQSLLHPCLPSVTLVLLSIYCNRLLLHPKEVCPWRLTRSPGPLIPPSLSYMGICQVSQSLLPRLSLTFTLSINSSFFVCNESSNQFSHHLLQQNTLCTLYKPPGLVVYDPVTILVDRAFGIPYECQGLW